MSDIRTSRNGHQGADGDDPSRPANPANVCPVCGSAGDTSSPGIGSLTEADGELPPPPRPLPEAVARVAAGLLLAPERAGPAGLPVVAGYEILGPLGRGGMGLVYQARQVKSGRTVALKMILGGAHAGPRDLARFRAEAAAVARLAHPHIVQIYDVGEHGGWAYFALEYVPGGSLARQLAGRPQPAGPSVRLVETLARAMAYAHERGVVHRDLKPANVLLSWSRAAPAERGQDSAHSAGAARLHEAVPKITDFGLAKRLDTEPGTVPSRDRTRTGEILGTPSYMAPEQTSGRTGAVGPAADVYALGAILYECLTGRPPFQAATPLDTLLQVREEDPVPPRRLVPSMPRDLETICLKCLQKEPRRRYPSAAALADDLQRFLAGERVQARPAGSWERAMQWARRRKAVAALITVSGAAALSLLMLGTWHQVRLRGYNAELRAERDAADGLRELAQAKEAEARRQKDEAEAHFQSALAAVKQMLVRVSEEDERLAHEPRMELVRRNLLEDALRFYQGFLEQKGTDPVVRQETASTYLRVGDIRKRLGQQAAAEEGYGAAIALFQGLASEFPGQPAYRHELAGCYTNLGTLLANTPRQQQAERAFHQARDIQQALVGEYPESGLYLSALAGSDHNLSTLLTNARRLPEAERALRRALESRRQLAEKFPEKPLYRRDLARTQHNLGGVLDLSGRRREAEPAFRQALELQRRLAEESPRVPAYRQELAGSHSGLAIVLATTGRLKEAETEYAQALVLQRRLVEDFPRVPAHRQELARSHYNLGRFLQRTGRTEEAEQAYQRTLDLQQRLAEEIPGVPTQHNELGRTSAQLAELLLGQGRLAEARRQGERAVREQQAALKLLPGQPAYGRALGQHYRVLAETLLQLGDHAAAAQAATELYQGAASEERVVHFAAGLLARCVSLAERDPTLSEEERKALAREYGDQAMTLLKQGLQQGPGSKRMQADPHLAPLRPRADFQRMVKDLEGSSELPDSR